MDLQSLWRGSASEPVKGARSGEAECGAWCDVDPLDDDQATQRVVITTDRGLVRLVVAASEVGARFAREGIAQDPAAWMFAPRAMFDGRSGVEACQELRHFNRNVLVHGLALGLDAHPFELDDLLSDACDIAAAQPVPTASGQGHLREGEAAPCGGRRLLTCWIDEESDGSRLFAFSAMVTDDPARMIEGLVRRFGGAVIAAATFSTGFDPASPLARALITDSMAETLKLAAEWPDSPLAEGLDVVVEQRFPS